jgi:hypothetical protein
MDPNHLTWSASAWTLTSDQALVDLIAASSGNILNRCHSVKASLDQLEASAAATRRGVDDVAQSVVDLSHSQFVENRVADPPLARPAAGKSASASQNKHAKKSAPQDIPDEQALMEQIEAALSDVDPVNEKPLPHIIGSDEFFSDPTLGLFAHHDEDSLHTPGKSPTALPPSSRAGGGSAAGNHASTRDAELEADAQRGSKYYDELFSDPALFQSALFPGSSPAPAAAAAIVAAAASPPVLPQTSYSTAVSAATVVPAAAPAIPPRKPAPAAASAALVHPAAPAAAADDHADLFGEDVIPFAAKPRRALFEDKDDEDDDDGLVY